MVNGNDFADFGSDIVKGTGKAITNSFNSTNGNSTMHILTGVGSIVLCHQMLKYNAIPLATMGVCIGAAIFNLSPAYKSVKAFLETPFKGFE